MVEITDLISHFPWLLMGDGDREAKSTTDDARGEAAISDPKKR
jgi:hypothetical protein